MYIWQTLYFLNSWGSEFSEFPNFSIQKPNKIIKYDGKFNFLPNLGQKTPQGPLNLVFLIKKTLESKIWLLAYSAPHEIPFWDNDPSKLPQWRPWRPKKFRSGASELQKPPKFRFFSISKIQLLAYSAQNLINFLGNGPSH